MDSKVPFNEFGSLNYHFPFLDFTKTSTIVLILFLIMLFYYIYKRIGKYVDKRNKLKELAANYERKRESRNEYKFHYFWALDRGENKEARSIGYQVMDLDKELKRLYEEYQFFKKNGFSENKKE